MPLKIHHILYLFFIILLAFLATSLSAQEYETTRIGDQEWMRTNLEVDFLGSICYNKDTSYCKKYGRLYSWQAAIGACPNGFRLPVDEDWTILTNYLGGSEAAGKALKKSGSSGFEVQLAGNYHPEVDLFSYINEKGFYWTASSKSYHTAYIRTLNVGADSVRRTSIGKSFYFSVRCIKVD